MKTSTIQLLAIASAFSVGFAAPVPAEISPIAQYYDTTVAAQKSDSGKAADALGFKRRQDTAPVTEYVDKTVKDSEAQAGKLGDALRMRAEVTTLGKYADKTVTDEKDHVGNALASIKFRRYNPTKPVQSYVNKTMSYVKSPRGEYLPIVEHKPKGDDKHEHEHDEHDHEHKNEHEEHNDKDVLEYKLNGEYAEVPPKKDSGNYVKGTVDEYAKKVPAAPKPAYPGHHKEEGEDEEGKGYDIFEGIDLDKRQTEQLDSVTKKLTSTGILRRQEEEEERKRQIDDFDRAANSITDFDLGKRQENVGDAVKDVSQDVGKDLKPVKEFEGIADDFKKRQESVSDGVKDVGKDFKPVKEVEDVTDDFKKRQQPQGEGEGKGKGEDDEEGDKEEHEADLEGEEGEHEGEDEGKGGKEGGKKPEGESKDAKKPEGEGEGGKKPEGESEGGKKPAGEEEEGEGEGEGESSKTPSNNPLGLRKRYNQNSQPAEPSHPEPKQPEEEQHNKPHHHGEEEDAEDQYYEAQEYKTEVDSAVEYTNSKTNAYSGGVAPKVPSTYDEEEDYKHEEEQAYDSDNEDKEIKDYIVTPKKSDYEAYVPAKPSAVPAYPAVPAMPTYPAAMVPKPVYSAAPTPSKGDKYPTPVHEVVDYVVSAVPKNEYEAETKPAHEEPEHQEPEHEHQEPQHEEPKHEEKPKPKHDSYDIFEDLDLSKRAPVDVKPLGQYVDTTVAQEKSGAGKVADGAKGSKAAAPSPSAKPAARK